ncbi:DNA gyrase subunit A [Flavipsychrobacter stenotrophus]|uniref:DNA gyrase subunit A n=1 Tax=Flavipsychrobacter stenotrophus TaxID=2077091 RepID=A0A2S7SSX4_9BACT|nr:DNA gyrase subunit A [Flavipsychrobacter stenotrophus]PQJ10020.1 DNA gyrase subunit A [Flavipsychrobacter stenotrophus]
MDQNNDNLLPQETPEENDKIIRVNIEEQMKTAYIDYSMSVIVGRALPDVRDGLKPVHRRVLFAMHELGNTFNKPHKKSARIVGEVLGKYHPHGDTSVYDAIVRMAQPWSMRYMVVDGQGNFGSADGDGPAAMRYTEVRMHKLGEAMMEDLDKETVDFSLNFDDSLEEPTVLPTRIPQLLVNGSSGIAVGMATNMMPHNLTEVIDGCIAYIDDRDITIEDLMKYVKAPDFPTGGIIFGVEGIKAGFMTGRGRVVLRGKVNVETQKNGRETIVITEVPYQVNRDALTEKIGYLVNSKIIDGITHVANESNKEGTRVVVEIRRDAVAQVIINQLYKYSELQKSYGINNVALVNGRPRTLNLKDLISEFITFRHEVVVRRTEYELREAKKRAHILEGYLIALDHLDAVIALIRNSTTPDIAKEGLITQFGMTEIQAKAVLELRLQRLTGMEINKIVEEHAELMKLIAHLQGILDNVDQRYQIIKDELLEIQKKFGDERKSEIHYMADEMSIEDLIEKEDVIITVSHLGYIKRTSADEYRSQRRGGRGAMGGKTREEDYIEHLFVASTHHTLMFFTEKGRCYWLKVYEIPEGDKNGRGRAIQNMMQIPADDKIRTVIDVPKLEDKEFIDSHFLVLCTKKGIIKKTRLEDFSRPRSTGVNAITIEEGDELLDVSLTQDGDYVMMAIRSGRAVCFPQEKVRPTGRGAIGVFGIELDENNDEVIGMICVSKKEVNKQIMVVSEKGMGKRTPFFKKVEEIEAVEGEEQAEDASNIILINDENGDPQKYALSYRVTNRGGKGVKTMNITDKTGPLVGLLIVDESDDLIITCESGVTIRMKVDNIRETGRTAQGVKLINIDAKDKIAAVASIKEQAVVGSDDDDITEEGGEAEGAGNGDGESDDAGTETGPEVVG